MNYINTFLFYSIIGHILENFTYSKIDSGILYGYWTPIYGIGVLLMILTFNIITKCVNNKILRIFVLFISSFLTLGLLEFFGGLLIEKLFGRVFWDYSNQNFNIGKYTSLKMMLLWGIASVIVIYIINPFVDLFLKKIPKSVTITLAFLFLFDLIYTLITLN